MASSTLCIHLVSLVVNIHTTYYNIMYVHERGESVLEYKGFGGKFKYLTFLNLIIQTVYFALSIINDLFGSNDVSEDGSKKRSKLQQIRDTIATSIAFPFGVFVVLTFWGLYAVDRELVFPKHLDSIVPAWLNHTLHTTVLPFLLIDKCMVYHQYPSRMKGLCLTVGVSMLYQVWILWIAYFADIWVYPILAVLAWPGRAAFLGGCWVAVIVIYLLGEAVTSVLWGSAAAKGKKTA